MYVILVYDIKTEDRFSYRWRNIFKNCKKYLTHIQGSVFEGELSEGQLFELKKTLLKYIDKDLDSIVVYIFRNKNWNKKEFWGTLEDKTLNQF